MPLLLFDSHSPIVYSTAIGSSVPSLPSPGFYSLLPPLLSLTSTATESRSITIFFAAGCFSCKVRRFYKFHLQYPACSIVLHLLSLTFPAAETRFHIVPLLLGLLATRYTFVHSINSFSDFLFQCSFSSSNFAHHGEQITYHFFASFNSFLPALCWATYHRFVTVLLATRYT